MSLFNITDSFAWIKDTMMQNQSSNRSIKKEKSLNEMKDHKYNENTNITSSETVNETLDLNYLFNESLNINQKPIIGQKLNDNKHSQHRVKKKKSKKQCKEIKVLKANKTSIPQINDVYDAVILGYIRNINAAMFEPEISNIIKSMWITDKFYDKIVGPYISFDVLRQKIIFKSNEKVWNTVYGSHILEKNESYQWRIGVKDAFVMIGMIENKESNLLETCDTNIDCSDIYGHGICVKDRFVINNFDPWNSGKSMGRFIPLESEEIVEININTSDSGFISYKINNKPCGRSLLFSEYIKPKQIKQWRLCVSVYCECSESAEIALL